MIRNPNRRQQQDILRSVRINSSPAAQFTRPGTGVKAGINSVSGEWVPFGILDKTQLDTGDGFVLSEETTPENS
jgi:hypothetical protein